MITSAAEGVRPAPIVVGHRGSDSVAATATSRCRYRNVSVPAQKQGAPSFRNPQPRRCGIALDPVYKRDFPRGRGRSSFRKIPIPRIVPQPRDPSREQEEHATKRSGALGLHRGLAVVRISRPSFSPTARPTKLEGRVRPVSAGRYRQSASPQVQTPGTDQPPGPHPVIVANQGDGVLSPPHVSGSPIAQAYSPSAPCRTEIANRVPSDRVRVRAVSVNPQPRPRRLRIVHRAAAVNQRPYPRPPAHPYPRPFTHPSRVRYPRPFTRPSYCNP